MHSLLEQIILVVLTLNLLLPVILFMFYYGTRSKWWATPLGKAFMLQQAAVVGLAVLSLIRTLWPFENWVFGLKVALLSVGIYAFWVIFASLRRIQKDTLTTTIQTVETEKEKEL